MNTCVFITLFINLIDKKLLINVVCVQVHLKQLVLYTHREKLEYSVAAERRRMRLLHVEIMKDLLNDAAFQASKSEGVCGKR